MKQVILTAWICIIVAFVAYKIGDSRGFQAGYQAGYIYDCKDEVRLLRGAHEDLKKAVDFAHRKASQVQQENARLQYSREFFQDSIRNVERVRFLEDSLKKHPDPRGGVYVNPYTGQVVKGALRALRDAEDDLRKQDSR